MPSVFGVLTLVAALALAGAANEESPLIKRTHTALANVLTFLLDDYRQINIDCLYGVVLAHGYLENILQLELNQGDLDLINGYKHKIEQIVTLAKPIILKSNKNDRIFVEHIINTKRWNRKVHFKRNQIESTFSPKHDILSKDDYLKFESVSNFEESRSDECLMEIINSGHYDVPHNCSLNEWCINNMVNNNDIEPAYVVTHRLLLLQLAKTQNCFIDPKGYANKIRSYCTYINWEVRQNKKFGFLKVLDDLLMEQLTLCGSEGFMEFVDKDFIEYILGIQTEHGCFRVAVYKRKTKRPKRTANYIKHGCNDHSTGLGTSVLSLFLLSLYQTGEML